MNIIFWMLVVIGLFLFWLCCAMAFRQIGKPVKHLFSVANEEISKDDMEDEEK